MNEEASYKRGTTGIRIGESFGDKEIPDNYGRYLERQALYKSFGYDVEEERNFILAAAAPVRGRIIEAGTGKGHFALALAKAGHSFVSFDISAQEQRFAGLLLEYFGLRDQADLRIENGECTSFPGGSFDIVFSVNVLHHLPNPYSVLDELVRLLFSGGKLVLSDFTPEGFKVMEKIHSLEGNVHETGKAGLTEAGAYLAGKGFLVRKVSSVYQTVLIAEKNGGAS
ncbi:MAG: class I SAM-dependent methyltransferase [Elusimicrobia bacterium]|nr:class I SAM-dependent methyltransferase [Elusimicrobiota bacterium]